MITDPQTGRRVAIDPETGTMDRVDFCFLRDNYGYGKDPVVAWLLDEIMKAGRAMDIMRSLLYQYAVVARKDKMGHDPDRRDKKNGYRCQVCRAATWKSYKRALSHKKRCPLYGYEPERLYGGFAKEDGG